MQSLSGEPCSTRPRQKRRGWKDRARTRDGLRLEIEVDSVASRRYGTLLGASWVSTCEGEYIWVLGLGCGSSLIRALNLPLCQKKKKKKAGGPCPAYSIPCAHSP